MAPKNAAPTAEESAAMVTAILQAYDAAAPQWAGRAAHWYADYRSRCTATADTLGIAHHCGIVAAALGSINSDPDRALGWLTAYVSGRGKAGHVSAVLDRAPYVLASGCFDDARSAMLDPKSDARKVRAFACNIETGGRPCFHDVPCVTVDRWAHRIATEWAREDVPQGARYTGVAQCYRDAAALRGVSPATMQAVTWESVATCENGGRSGRAGCACSACSTVREHRA